MKISEITVNEGINDKYIGKCVFTAGAPASGKTTISRKLFSHLGFREVNIDKLLEFFAEIKGLDLKNMHTWDQEIFDRSEDLTFNSMEMFIKGRLPLLIDGTGRNYKKITQLATRLKEDYGYDAGLLFVNTSLQVSISRNADRKRSLTDMQYIKDAWKDSQSNLGIYQNFFGNNLFIVDNDFRTDADLTSVSKRIDKFIDTPTKNLKFNQWIADEKKKRNITEAFLTNSTYYTADMLTEQKLYEGFLDTAKQYLGSKYNMKISDISGAINDMREAGILIKEIIQSPEYLEKVMTQLKKTVKGFIKQMTNAVKSNETLEKLWNSIKNRVLKITSAIGWKGFLANLGMSGFLQFLLINGKTLKQNTALEIMDLVVDLEKLLPNATLPGFLQLYEGLQLAKKYFFDILTNIQRKLDFGKNLTEEENSESEIRQIAEDFREWMEDKGYEEMRGHAFDSTKKEAYSKFEGLCNKASRKLAKIYNDKGYNAVSRLITYYGDDLTFWERHGIAFFDNEEDFEEADAWEFGEDHEVVIIDDKIVVDVTSDQFNPENPDDHRVVVVPISDRRYR
jgi:adenylate kinase family enzyme